MYNTKDPSETLALNPASSDAVLNPDAMTLKRVAHYDLRQEIGRGGMSVVYEAQDSRTGQDIALKLLTLPDSLTPEQAGNLAARFDLGARTVARLSHPNVVCIREIGVYHDQHFLAMEYLRGQTLRERMSKGKFTPREACMLLTQIAEALDAAHHAGIVYRDVKPTNIMLLPNGTVKLLDLGIAQSSDVTTLTDAGIVVGSPFYMAPELVKGDPGTEATDIWALGVLSCEMISGHLPFTGQTLGNVLYQIVHQSPAPTPDLPEAVQKVLHRALDKRPSQRYSTASDFVQALSANLRKPVPAAPDAALGPAAPISAAPEPKSPPPPDPALFAPKPPAVSRRPLAVALLLLFLLGFFGAFWERQHVSHAAGKAAAAEISAQESSTQKTAARPAVQAPLPYALPAPMPVRALSGPPQAPTVPQRHPVALVRSEPLPHKDPAARSSQTLQPDQALLHQALLPPRPISLPSAAVPPVRHRLSPVIFRQTADHHASAQSAGHHVSPQSAGHYAPKQNTDPQAPVQNIDPPVPAQNTDRSEPVQSTAQGFTLPAGSAGDDPEADARLRKSAWSQSGSESNPQR